MVKEGDVSLKDNPKTKKTERQIAPKSKEFREAFREDSTLVIGPDL